MADASPLTSDIGHDATGQRKEIPQPPAALHSAQEDEIDATTDPSAEKDAVHFFGNIESTDTAAAEGGSEVEETSSSLGEVNAGNVGNATTPGDGKSKQPAAARRQTPPPTLAELAAHASSAAVLVWKEISESHRRALLGAAAMAVASLPTAAAHAQGVEFLCDPRTCKALSLPETAAQGLLPLMGPPPEYGPTGKQTNGVDLGPECPFTAEVPQELRRMFLVALLAHTIATNRYKPAVRAMFQRLSKLLGVNWRLIAACEDALVLRAASAVLQGHKDAKEKSASGYRLMKIAAVGIVGGTAVVLTAGIAAPAVLAGVGVLGAAVGGGVAVATGTVVAFFSSAAGGVLLLSLFGAAGTSLGAFRMGRATGGIEVFDLRRLSPRPVRLQSALERQVAQLAAKAEAAEAAASPPSHVTAVSTQGTQAARAPQDKAKGGGKGKSWNPLSWIPPVSMPSVNLFGKGDKGGSEQQRGTQEGAHTDGSTPPAFSAASGAGEGGAAYHLSEVEMDMLSDDESVPTSGTHEAAAAAAAVRVQTGKGESKNKEQKAATAAAAKGTAVQSGGLHVFICAAGVATHEGAPDVDFLAPWGGRSNRQVQLTADALQWHLQEETRAVSAGATGSQAAAAAAPTDQEGGDLPAIFRSPFWRDHRSLTPTASMDVDAVARRGWMRAQCPYGELYTLTWEPDAMLRLGNTIAKWLQNLVKDQVVGQILKRTALATLLSAWQLPSTVFWGLSWIDTPFSVAVDRADKAGRVLGHTLLSRAQGSRPVSLVGYSMGARVMFRAAHVIHQRWTDTKDKPLPEGGSGSGPTATGPDGLAWGDACLELVQDIVLAGAPVSASPVAWEPLRQVAAGRVVNAYSSVDFVLIFLYRSNRLAWHVAGVGPVGVTDSKELSEATKRGEGGLEVEVTPQPEAKQSTSSDEAGSAQEEVSAVGAAGAAPKESATRSEDAAAGGDCSPSSPASSGDTDEQQHSQKHDDEQGPPAPTVASMRAEGEGDGGNGAHSAFEAAVTAGRRLAAQAQGSGAHLRNRLSGAAGASKCDDKLREALRKVHYSCFKGIENWNVTALVGNHLDYAQRMAEICGAVNLDGVTPSQTEASSCS